MARGSGRTGPTDRGGDRIRRRRVRVPAGGVGDAGLGGQLLQGLAEIQAVDAAVEIEDVPGRLAAETVEQALFLVDRETGLGLLMEGAGRHPARPVTLEIHVTAHDIRDVEPLLDGADGISGLHEAPAGLPGCASAG